MKSRDWLIEKFPEMTPKFPCTHRENCPMLEYSQHDWCHGELTWTRSRLVRQFDELLGFNKHKLKYCGFIFQKHGHLGDSYRVVSFPKKNKAGFSAWLCGQKFYQIVSLAKKNRSETNVTFQKVNLLDQIEIQNWERGGHLQFEAKVSKIRASV